MLVLNRLKLCVCMHKSGGELYLRFGKVKVPVKTTKTIFTFTSDITVPMTQQVDLMYTTGTQISKLLSTDISKAASDDTVLASACLTQLKSS